MSVWSRVWIALFACVAGALLVRTGAALFLAPEVGSDYTFFLPRLVYGYYWFRLNGLAAIPWYSPAWCAGLPYFADPQVMYYSLPQWLLLLADPLWSLFLTFVLFTGVGATAMYLLLRQAYGVNHWLALTGAILFACNEFYLNRMAVGHLTYHMYPLIPLIALLVIRGVQSQQSSPGLVALNGLLIASFVHGGGANFVVPAMLSVSCLLGLYCLRDPGQFFTTCRLFLTGGVIAVALAAGKLVAAWSFIRWFPRSELNLGVFESVTESVFATFTMLFMNPWLTLADRPGQFLIQSHELRFGISPAALLLLLLGCFAIPRVVKRLEPKRIVLLCLILIIMVLPVLLSVNNPTMNALFKSVPYLKESSLALRWLALDIPVLIAIACWSSSRVLSPSVSVSTATVCIGLVLLSHLAWERPADARYPVATLSRAYDSARQGEALPVTGRVDAAGSRTFIGRGELFVDGQTPGVCYQPIFGYRLERYPIGLLQAGPLLTQVGDRLNLKQPACYVYPEENSCSPGDHFQLSDRARALQFMSHEPVDFPQSTLQQVANWTSGLALVGLILLMGLSLRWRRN